MVAAVPPACGLGKTPDQTAFAQWHSAVIANQAGKLPESSTAAAAVTLTPPLRMDLDWVRFSPDGRSLLAQDESSIFVIAREPLALRYRIDASGALPAQFSPDSQVVSFHTPGLHVEQWSAHEKKLLSARELYPRNACYDTRLSPDGRSLVCVEFDQENWELGLSLLDATTSEVLWENKRWLQPDGYLGSRLLFSKMIRNPSEIFLSSYSPDGNTLLFGGGSDKVAFDFRQRGILKTGRGIRNYLSGSYAFLGDHKLASVNLAQRTDSGVLSFPDGQMLQKVTMPFDDVHSVSDPGANLHLLAYGLKGFRVGLADLSSGKFLIALKTRALDEDAGTIVGETEGGWLSVGNLSDPRFSQKRVDLPLSPLPFSPIAALSSDGKYLALSIGNHGGIWNLETGKRFTMLRPFTDAVWSQDDTLYMDVPKDEAEARHIGQLAVAARTLKSLPYPVDDETHMRYGRLTDWKEDTKKKSWTLSLRDPATGHVLWSRSFPDHAFSYTASYGHRDLIFNFPLNSHMANQTIGAEPRLADQADGVKRKADARLIQVIRGDDGKEDGSLVVELPPNYAGTEGLNRAGDLLYVAGVDDRTLVYSITTGKQVRDLTGYLIALDPETGRVFTVNRIGEGSVYDSSGVQLTHYRLDDAIRFASFGDKAASVRLLTADQQVRTMSVDVLPGKAQAVPQASLPAAP